MSEYTKIAVTVPTDIYAVVERLRRKLGKSRSAVVALALEEWVRGTDVSDLDRRYAEGYLRTPENLAELRAVAAQATSQWSPWEPGAPARAAKPAKRRARRRARQ